MRKQKKLEAVHHPRHYNLGIVEHCELVEDQGYADGYLFGQVTKYAFRAGRKHGASKLEDLEKLAWYAKRWVAWHKHGKKIWKFGPVRPERNFIP